MNKTSVLIACMLILGAVAVAPAADAFHAPRGWPEENGSCVYNAFTGEVCVISDDGWCWIFWHCPW